MDKILHLLIKAHSRLIGTNTRKLALTPTQKAQLPQLFLVTNE